MTPTFVYPITEENQGFRVSDFLASKGYSNHLRIALKKSPNGLLINQEPVFSNYILTAGETLVVTLPEETSSQNIVPTPMDLTIVYEDRDILVINKEANVPIHPSQGNYENTLANGVMHYFLEKGESCVFRVINRLDRDTTGLLIIAKHALSACILSGMVSNREISRTYRAIVCGDVRSLDSIMDYQFTIDAAIARVHDSTIEREVNEQLGESAITHGLFLSYHQDTDTSFIQLKLETGRTHQIRVHMKHVGFPLPGDFLYHPDYRYIKRQSLHSYELIFLHPITKEVMHFIAPLPEDMERFVSDSSSFITETRVY